MSEALAGSVIETLYGWAACSAEGGLLAYHPTREAAEAEVRRFYDSIPISFDEIMSDGYGSIENDNPTPN